jgi:hypothetical protein
MPPPRKTNGSSTWITDGDFISQPEDLAGPTSVRLPTECEELDELHQHDHRGSPCPPTPASMRPST